MEMGREAKGAVPARLGLFDAVSIIVGIVIGSTIYKSPQLIMNNVTSPAWGSVRQFFGFIRASVWKRAQSSAVAAEMRSSPVMALKAAMASRHSASVFSARAFAAGRSSGQSARPARLQSRRL